MTDTVVDLMTVGLAPLLLIFDSTNTNRMSLDEGASTGDHMKALIRIETLPVGTLYDHDGTSDAVVVPDKLELSYILKQPTKSDVDSTFASFKQHLGKEMTLRTRASTTATAKMFKCRRTYLHYGPNSDPYTVRIEFGWQLKEDFS